MISRISAIYQEAYCKSSMADIKDSKLSYDIIKELDRLTDYGALTRDEIEVIIYAGCCL